MPSSKTPQKISEELGNLGELYALPKTLEGYSDVIATNDESGMHYRAMNVNRDLHDWLRSSMQSLLLYVMGEMVSKQQPWDEFWEARKKQVKEYDAVDERECKEYWRTRYDAINSCLAVIQSTIDSIKE